MAAAEDPRDKALADYKKKLLQHKEVDSKVRALREEVKTAKKEYDKTEDDLKALQSVGQIIGEVLRQLDDERCEWAGVTGGASGGQQLISGSAGRRVSQPCGRRQVSATGNGINSLQFHSSSCLNVCWHIFHKLLRAWPPNCQRASMPQAWHRRQS